MSKLKLGPVADDKPVKVMVEMPATVHRALLAYARLHADETGLGQPLAVERLIPPMLERFMEGDRGFARRRRTSPTN